MASRALRAPRRVLPGEIDVHSDLAFVAEVSRMAVSGELSCLDAVRIISHSVVARDPQRIADWAAANLIVPAGKSSRPGPMRLTAMQAAIGDIVQLPEVRQVTYVKGPQIGFSFLIAAVKLYYGAHENKPTMFYDRALKNARSFYEEKYEAIFAASDEISHLLPDERSSVDRQRWTDRTLTTGAGARFRSVSDKIKSDTATVLCADEAGDPAYMNKGKNKEGSKVGLLRARVVDQPDSKILLGGTPTAAGESAVTDEWERSNKCEWIMRFECCGTEGPFVDDVREIRPEDVDIPHGPGLRYLRNDKGHCAEIWYECAGCNRLIPPTEKVALLGSGRWVPTAEGDPGHWGVRSWMAHSQSIEATWTHIGDAHIAAVETPDKMQVFTNLWLAREWKPPTLKTIDVMDLKKKEVVLVDGKLPRHIRALVAGIDGQRGTDDGSKPGRMEIVIVAIGENMRFHPVQHHVVDHRETVDRQTGEIVRSPVLPFSSQARQPVMDILDQSFETEDGRVLRIINTCADVGYEMQQATEFVQSISTPTRPVVPIRGSSESGRITPIGADREHRSFVFRNGIRVQKLGTTSIKDYIADTLSFPTPGPQSWTFPLDTADTFYGDLLAEHLVTQPSGRTVWKRKNERVTGEVWDCIVYAYAALLMMMYWTGEWGQNVLIPQIRIQPQAVEASILAEAARVQAETKAETRPAPVGRAETPAQNPAQASTETIVEAVRRTLDDMFETIDDGPAFEIVRPKRQPAPEPEAEENPFIVAGRR